MDILTAILVIAVAVIGFSAFFILPVIVAKHEARFDDVEHPTP